MCTLGVLGYVYLGSVRRRWRHWMWYYKAIALEILTTRNQGGLQALTSRFRPPLALCVTRADTMTRTKTLAHKLTTPYFDKRPIWNFLLFRWWSTHMAMLIKSRNLMEGRSFLIILTILIAIIILCQESFQFKNLHHIQLGLWVPTWITRVPWQLAGGHPQNIVVIIMLLMIMTIMNIGKLSRHPSAIPCRLLTYCSGVHIYDNYK